MLKQAIRHQGYVVLAAVLVFFTNLGSATLWDRDEPRNAACAREMLERGDWIVPSFNGALRTDKPILIYWCMLVSYHWLGVSEFSARLWSALFATGTLLLTYSIGRLLFRTSVGMWSGIVLAGTLLFGVAARAATPDSTLIFFSTLAIYLFLSSSVKNSLTGSNAAGLGSASSAMPLGRLSLLVYAAMGCAVLAKGPAGLVLPLLVMSTFLWFRLPKAESTRIVSDPVYTAVVPRLWHGWAVVRALRPLAGLAVVAAVALPWYVAVGIETDGKWLAGFLGKHNVSRFMSPMEGHGGPVVYYIPAVLLGFLPWSVLLPSALLQLVQRLRQPSCHHWGDVFLACWAGTYLLFFSLASTKLPSYVLPCYPALALLVGRFIDGWIMQPAHLHRQTARAVFGAGIGVGVAFCIAAPVVIRKMLPGESWIVLVGLIPMIGFALTLFWSEVGRVQTSAITLSITATLLATAIFAGIGPRMDRHKVNAALMDRIRELTPRDFEVCSYEYAEPSLVFYAGQTVQDFSANFQAANFLRNAERRYLIATSDRLHELKPFLPPGVAVLDHWPMFLNPKDEVLLLGWPKDRSMPTVAKCPYPAIVQTVFARPASATAR